MYSLALDTFGNRMFASRLLNVSYGNEKDTIVHNVVNGTELHRRTRGDPVVNGRLTGKIHHSVFRPYNNSRMEYVSNAYVYTYHFYYPWNGCSNQLLATSIDGKYQGMEYVMCPDGSHENDWEHLKVWVCESDMLNPDPRRAIARMQVSQHTWIVDVDCFAGECPFQSDDKGVMHPILISGQGSHSLWPHETPLYVYAKLSSKYVLNLDGLYIADRYKKGPVFIPTSENVRHFPLPFQTDPNYSYPEWLRYRGSWGATLTGTGSSLECYFDNFTRLGSCPKDNPAFYWLSYFVRPSSSSSEMVNYSASYSVNVIQQLSPLTGPLYRPYSYVWESERSAPLSDLQILHTPVMVDLGFRFIESCPMSGDPTTSQLEATVYHRASIITFVIIISSLVFVGGVFVSFSTAFASSGRPRKLYASVHHLWHLAALSDLKPSLLPCLQAERREDRSLDELSKEAEDQGKNWSGEGQGGTAKTENKCKEVMVNGKRNAKNSTGRFTLTNPALSASNSRTYPPSNFPSSRSRSSSSDTPLSSLPPPTTKSSTQIISPLSGRSNSGGISGNFRTAKSGRLSPATQTSLLPRSSGNLGSFRGRRESGNSVGNSGNSPCDIGEVGEDSGEKREISIEEGSTTTMERCVSSFSLKPSLPALSPFVSSCISSSSLPSDLPITTLSTPTVSQLSTAVFTDSNSNADSETLTNVVTTSSPFSPSLSLTLFSSSPPNSIKAASHSPPPLSSIPVAAPKQSRGKLILLSRAPSSLNDFSMGASGRSPIDELSSSSVLDNVCVLNDFFASRRTGSDSRDTSDSNGGVDQRENLIKENVEHQATIKTSRYSNVIHRSTDDVRNLDPIFADNLDHDDGGISNSVSSFDKSDVLDSTSSKNKLGSNENPHFFGSNRRDKDQRVTEFSNVSPLTSSKESGELNENSSVRVIECLGNSTSDLTLFETGALVAKASVGIVDDEKNDKGMDRLEMMAHPIDNVKDAINDEINSDDRYGKGSRKPSKLDIHRSTSSRNYQKDLREFYSEAAGKLMTAMDEAVGLERFMKESSSTDSIPTNLFKTQPNSLPDAHYRAEVAQDDFEKDVVEVSLALPSLPSSISSQAESSQKMVKKNDESLNPMIIISDTGALDDAHKHQATRSQEAVNTDESQTLSKSRFSSNLTGHLDPSFECDALLLSPTRYLVSSKDDNCFFPSTSPTKTSDDLKSSSLDESSMLQPLGIHPSGLESDVASPILSGKKESLNVRSRAFSEEESLAEEIMHNQAREKISKSKTLDEKNKRDGSTLLDSSFNANRKTFGERTSSASSLHKNRYWSDMGNDINPELARLALVLKGIQRSSPLSTFKVAVLLGLALACYIPGLVLILVALFQLVKALNELFSLAAWRQIERGMIVVVVGVFGGLQILMMLFCARLQHYRPVEQETEGRPIDGFPFFPAESRALISEEGDENYRHWIFSGRRGTKKMSGEVRAETDASEMRGKELRRHRDDTNLNLKDAHDNGDDDDGGDESASKSRSQTHQSIEMSSLLLNNSPLVVDAKALPRTRSLIVSDTDIDAVNSLSAARRASKDTNKDSIPTDMDASKESSRHSLSLQRNVSFPIEVLLTSTSALSTTLPSHKDSMELEARPRRRTRSRSDVDSLTLNFSSPHSDECLGSASGAGRVVVNQPRSEASLFTSQSGASVNSSFSNAHTPGNGNSSNNNISNNNGNNSNGNSNTNTNDNKTNKTNDNKNFSTSSTFPAHALSSSSHSNATRGVGNGIVRSKGKFGSGSGLRFGNEMASKSRLASGIISPLVSTTISTLGPLLNSTAAAAAASEKILAASTAIGSAVLSSVNTVVAGDENAERGGEGSIKKESYRQCPPSSFASSSSSAVGASSPSLTSGLKTVGSGIGSYIKNVLNRPFRARSDKGYRKLSREEKAWEEVGEEVGEEAGAAEMDRNEDEMNQLTNDQVKEGAKKAKLVRSDRGKQMPQMLQDDKSFSNVPSKPSPLVSGATAPFFSPPFSKASNPNLSQLTSLRSPPSCPPSHPVLRKGGGLVRLSRVMAAFMASQPPEWKSYVAMAGALVAAINITLILFAGGFTLWVLRLALNRGCYAAVSGIFRNAAFVPSVCLDLSQLLGVSKPVCGETVLEACMLWYDIKLDYFAYGSLLFLISHIILLVLAIIRYRCSSTGNSIQRLVRQLYGPMTKQKDRLTKEVAYGKREKRGGGAFRKRRKGGDGDGDEDEEEGEGEGKGSSVKKDGGKARKRGSEFKFGDHGEDDLTRSQVSDSDAKLNPSFSEKEPLFKSSNTPNDLSASLPLFSSEPAPSQRPWMIRLVLAPFTLAAALVMLPWRVVRSVISESETSRSRRRSVTRSGEKDGGAGSKTNRDLDLGSPVKMSEKLGERWSRISTEDDMHHSASHSASSYSHINKEEGEGKGEGEGEGDEDNNGLGSSSYSDDDVYDEELLETNNNRVEGLLWKDKRRLFYRPYNSSSANSSSSSYSFYPYDSTTRRIISNEKVSEARQLYNGALSDSPNNFVPKDGSEKTPFHPSPSYRRNPKIATVSDPASLPSNLSSSSSSYVSVRHRPWNGWRGFFGSAKDWWYGYGNRKYFNLGLIPGEEASAGHEAGGNSEKLNRRADREEPMMSHVGNVREEKDLEKLGLLYETRTKEREGQGEIGKWNGATGAIGRKSEGVNYNVEGLPISTGADGPETMNAQGLDAFNSTRSYGYDDEANAKRWNNNYYESIVPTGNDNSYNRSNDNNNNNNNNNMIYMDGKNKLVPKIFDEEQFNGSFSRPQSSPHSWNSKSNSNFSQNRSDFNFFPATYTPFIESMNHLKSSENVDSNSTTLSSLECKKQQEKTADEMMNFPSPVPALSSTLFAHSSLIPESNISSPRSWPEPEHQSGDLHFSGSRLETGSMDLGSRSRSGSIVQLTSALPQRLTIKNRRGSEQL